jgi:ribosomal-protein-alanine N-acetyltransferase
LPRCRPAPPARRRQDACGAGVKIALNHGDGKKFAMRGAHAGKEAHVSSGQFQKQAISIQVRWMIRRDLPEVLAIEHESFEFKWTEEDFLGCLRQRNCIGMVAEHDGRIVGFMIYELHKAKLQILNFAVARHCRRRGVGGQMVEKLVDKLSQQRRNEIALEVRETNVPAQHFFHSQGFRAVRVLRDHYADSSEDAYVMQFLLDAAEPEAGAPVNRISRC